MEEWEIELLASSMDDKEFPLLVEVSDDEDINKNSGLEEEIEEFLNDLSEDETETVDSDAEEDEDVYESKALIAALREGKELPSPTTRNSSNEGTLTKIRKSSKTLEQPLRTKEENKTFIVIVKVNSQEAIVLLDSGCTMDAISPEVVRVMDLKVYELMEQVPIQLGTRGSQSKINYGTKMCIKYGHVDACHYFDIVNIDRYDVILGMVFMRKHRIILDFECDEVRHKEQILPSIKEGPDAYLMVCRQAI